LRYPRFVVQNLNNYAYSALSSKDYAKAESLLNKSLKICKMYTDPVLLFNYAEGEAPNAKEFDWWESNYISSTLAALAEVATSQKRYSDALQYLEQIHTMNVKLNTVKGELQPHYSVMDLMVRIGEMHYLLGDRANATKVFNEVIELDKKYMGAIVGKSRVSTGIAYRFKGKMELEEGNLKEASRLLALSLQIHSTVLGTHNYKTLHALADMGRAHFALGEYEKARVVIEEAGTYFQHANDQEMTAELAALHKEIFTHLPGKVNPLLQNL